MLSWLQNLRPISSSLPQWRRDGAIFKEKDGPGENLLASSDDWVAPVFADIGPDENIWVADWYNPVIQHNPDRRGMRNQVWNANRGPRATPT